MKTPNSKLQTPEKKAPSASGFTWVKVRFFIEVGTRGCEGVDLEAKATMPFPPQIGMWVIAVRGDDYRKVDEVYWSEEEEGVLVYLEFAESGSRQMKKLGWRVAHQ